jgi:hypothetical protein
MDFHILIDDGVNVSLQLARQNQADDEKQSDDEGQSDITYAYFHPDRLFLRHPFHLYTPNDSYIRRQAMNKLDGDPLWLFPLNPITKKWAWL